MKKSAFDQNYCILTPTASEPMWFFLGNEKTHWNVFFQDFLFPYFYSIFSFELKIVGPSDGAAMTVGFKLDFLRSQIFPTAKISTNR